MDIKAEINGNTVIVGNFNTPLTSMDRPSRQKINNGLKYIRLVQLYRH